MFTADIIVQQIINGILTGANYVLVALGLTLIFGVYRIINLAHGAVYTWGAFICHFVATKMGYNIVLATIISMIFAGLLSVSLEKVVFRKVKGSADWVALVAGLGVYYALENFGWIVMGPRELHIHAVTTQKTLRVFNLYANYHRLLLAALCLITVLSIIAVLKRTNVGRAIRAASSDQEAALLMGINTNRISMLVFFWGGAFAALAGSMVGTFTSVNPSMGFNPMIIGFVIVVFGGMGSILGTVLAGLMVGVLQNILAYSVAPTFAYTFTMITLLMLFIIRPTGLFGEKS